MKKVKRLYEKVHTGPPISPSDTSHILFPKVLSKCIDIRQAYKLGKKIITFHVICYPASLFRQNDWHTETHVIHGLGIIP